MSCGVRSKGAFQAQRSRPGLRVLAAHGTRCEAGTRTGTEAGGQSPLWLRRMAATAAAASLTLSTAWVPASYAADPAAVGVCLLANCQAELAKCISDVGCLEDLICLQNCNGREDETACQIRCGDLYEDKAVATFNACAVSEKKCVPQRIDENLFPVPPDCALDRSFDLNNFQGRWYITAGYNKLFDTFDCQKHFFAVPSPGNLYAKINWRISRPDGDFIERSTVQTFVQDENNPAIMYNHGNEYLHYEDDWYILGFKPDEYIFIYYKGNNDAWRGYGGATVYTREEKLPEEYIPELRKQAESAGLKWEDFTITDNSCKPHPPPKKVREVLRETLEKDVQVVEKDIEESLVSFGRGLTVIESEVEEVLKKGLPASVPQVVQKDLKEAAEVLRRVEMQTGVADFFDNIAGFFGFNK